MIEFSKKMKSCPKFKYWSRQEADSPDDAAQLLHNNLLTDDVIFQSSVIPTFWTAISEAIHGSPSQWQAIRDEVVEYGLNSNRLTDLDSMRIKNENYAFDIKDAKATSAHLNLTINIIG